MTTKVVGERDYSDLDDKDFVRLRRKKNKLVTLMYSIFLIIGSYSNNVSG
jgi:hypothetical protein